MTNIIDWTTIIITIIPIALLVSTIGWMLNYFANDLIFNGKKKKKKKCFYCNYCGYKFNKKREVRKHHIKNCHLFFTFSLNPEWFRSVI